MVDSRYSRLEILEGIGPVGIRRLKEAKILVIGCGALGSLCAMYLASSGVGNLTIADFDTIDISNLQRQLFFTESELGKSKAEILSARLSAINSSINVTVESRLVKRDWALSNFEKYDFIVDGSDNPATKKMTAEVCEHIGMSYTIGGVRDFTGQVMSWCPGATGYLDLFGNISSCTGVTPCSVAGVLGPAAGIVASVQAGEVIKFITGAGKMLYDSLFMFDLRTMDTKVLCFE